MKNLLRLLLAAALLPAAHAAFPTLGGQSEFLPPDEAYQFSAWAKGDGTVTLNWVIAEDYYLYRQQTRVSTDTPGFTLGEPRFPQGEMHTDEFFGTQEVYRGVLDVVVPVTAGSGELQLRVRYQGCADAGLCYPPQIKTVTVAVDGPAAPGAVAAADEAPAGAGRLSETDRLAALIREGHLAWLVLAFAGFGLLLAFTPCVFPMVPILSSIIAGQGARITAMRGFTLSLAYVIGVALTYGALGVIFGATGANLQAILQAPGVLIATAVLFVLLALSMFGFYELQLPAFLRERLDAASRRQRGGHFTGVFVMGVLSALVVSPCVAAPLAAAFIVIAQSGDTLRGGLSLFSLGLGMGIPLLVLGASEGKLLPRAGAWMNAVKALFGVLLLAVAVWLLERIVPGWLNMLLWALLAIVSAVYMGALAQPAGNWMKLWKGLGFALLVWGVLLLVGLAGGHHDPLQPLKGFGGGAAVQEQHLAFKRIKTVEDLQRELAAAAQQNRPVMLDFYADWCISCKEMEKYTFTDPAVQSALANTVLLQADVTANDAADRALLDHFGLYGPPAIIFFDRRGRAIPGSRVDGYLPADEFVAHVNRVFE